MAAARAMVPMEVGDAEVPWEREMTVGPLEVVAEAPWVEAEQAAGMAARVEEAEGIPRRSTRRSRSLAHRC